MLRVFEPEPAPPGSTGPAETEFAEETEIVLGRRQVASLSFVVVVALAVASGASYLAGKAAAGKTPAPTRAEQSQVPPPPPLAVATPAEAKAAPVQPAPAKAVANATPTSESPGVQALIASDAAVPADESVFGEPVPGSLYIQVGAMDRGPAMILTASLRKRGFDAVTARGPSATIFRVLVGPYKSLPDYQNAKEAIAQMGITAFGRSTQ